MPSNSIQYSYNFKGYSDIPDENTTISGINIAEGCPPSGINNAIRQLMADCKKADDNLQRSILGTTNNMQLSMMQQYNKLATRLYSLAHNSEVNFGNCFRVGELQVCWGNDLADGHNISFTKPFKANDSYIVLNNCADTSGDNVNKVAAMTFGDSKDHFSMTLPGGTSRCWWVAIGYCTMDTVFPWQI